MASLDILMINNRPEDKVDLIKVFEKAKNYFPNGIWDNVTCIGKLDIEHDLQVETQGRLCGALIFKKLIKKIKKIYVSDRFMNLLIAVTQDPVIDLYYFFDGNNFKRLSYLIHDYMVKKFGIVSFFMLNGENSKKVIAHGLGHNKGLHHHAKPVDLMYSELLKTPKLQVEGFCEDCQEKLSHNLDNL